MSEPQVAFSQEFLESYSKLPRSVQKKARNFTEKFRRDPTQSGINFERLNAIADSKVRSVRIDQAYRAIVIHPPKDDVYLCVWVDQHDAAYRWVRNRRFEINPRSGTFQIFQAEASSDGAPSQPDISTTTKADTTAGLLDEHDDEVLLMAGVPQPLLAAVRVLATDDDLDQLAPHLPPDASEMLYMLAAGYSLTEAISEADRSTPVAQSVDVEDFEAALKRPESRRGFAIVENEDELEGMLNAPLEQWRVFLHASQRKLVEMHANGPVRVLGGAGTGKTVVLMHRARHLASRDFNGESDRILLTTFTKNLSLNLNMNLRNLCTPDIHARMEVVNLHGWVFEFMRKQGQRLRIASEGVRANMMEQAVSEIGDNAFGISFYRDEWDQVVQPQDVVARDDYLTARRVGRGSRISRRQRALVWQVLARYRELLENDGLLEWPDAVREARLFIEKQRVSFPYKAVLADETQDFSANDLRLLRAIAPGGKNSLFLVGDGHQRIYGRPVRLSQCGIDIRGRGRRLKLNYRTTEQIRAQAVRVLEGKNVDDLDGGLDSLKGYYSLRQGPAPTAEHFSREADEGAFILSTLEAWMQDSPAEEICIAARTQAQLDDRYARLLQSAGIDVVRVQRSPESEANKPGVRLATMHRLKGLEFSRVLLVGVQGGYVPLDATISGSEEADEIEHREVQERALLFVAMSRARDELAITGFGSESSILNTVVRN